MVNLIFLTCFIVFAFFTAVSMLIAGYIFSYKSYDKVKSSTYECGLAPETSAKVSFDIKYFRYLILFLVFDAAVIFIYPFVATAYEYSRFHVFSIILFLVLILLSLIYSFVGKFIGELK